MMPWNLSKKRKEKKRRKKTFDAVVWILFGARGSRF
jgi:hypothetical protein